MYIPLGAAKAIVILLLWRTAGCYCIVQFAAAQRLSQLCNTGPGLKGDWITFLRRTFQLQCSRIVEHYIQFHITWSTVSLAENSNEKS